MYKNQTSRSNQAEGDILVIGEQEESENDGIPLYSSHENLLIIPPSMSTELKKKAMEAQDALDRWSSNRRDIIKKLYSIAIELNEWDKGCAISTVIGSSVGIASGAAVIGGLIFAPYIAATGFVVGAVAGASNLITGVAKHKFSKNKIEEINELCKVDQKLFEKLLSSREDLMSWVEETLQNDYNREHFTTDSVNNVKSMLGFGAAGATGLGARITVTQIGRLSSSMVKGILHGMATIGIILDAVTFVVSANELIEGEPSKLGQSLIELGRNMDKERQKVTKEFLNNDVWYSDD